MMVATAYGIRWICGWQMCNGCGTLLLRQRLLQHDSARLPGAEHIGFDHHSNEGYLKCRENVTRAIESWQIDLFHLMKRQNNPDMVALALIV